MNYYSRYPSHYLSKTLLLSLEQDGAYGRLMDWYYSEERPIPHDKRYAVGRCQSARDKAAVDFVLHEYFLRDGDGWVHERIEKELAKAAPKIDAARANGRKGGRPRKEKPSGFSGNNPMGFQNETHNEPSAKAPQSPISNQEQRSKSLERQAARKTADRFADFWAAYPVKKGRAEAEAKWRARGLDAIADRIVADVNRRKTEDRQWLDGYAPHGSTYVNNRGWEDEIEPRRAQSTGGPGAREGPPRMGKTAQAIQVLEDMRNGNRLGIGRDFDGDAEATPAVAGIHSGG